MKKTQSIKSGGSQKIQIINQSKPSGQEFNSKTSSSKSSSKSSIHSRKNSENNSRSDISGRPQQNARSNQHSTSKKSNMENFSSIATAETADNGFKAKRNVTSCNNAETTSSSNKKIRKKVRFF